MDAILAFPLGIKLAGSGKYYLMSDVSGSPIKFHMICVASAGLVLQCVKWVIDKSRGLESGRESANALTAGSLKVVLMRRSDKNAWLLIQSQADSQELLSSLADLTKSTFMRRLLVGQNDAGMDYRVDSREFEDRLDAVLLRSMRVTRDTPYEDWKIDGWNHSVLKSIAGSWEVPGNVRTQRDLINYFKLPRQLLLATVGPEEAKGLTEEGFWDDDGFVWSESESDDRFEDESDDEDHSNEGQEDKQELDDAKAEVVVVPPNQWHDNQDIDCDRPVVGVYSEEIQDDYTETQGSGSEIIVDGCNCEVHQQ
ncbi:hypothetical protein ABVK25_011993 [Lepraria finkii]|uniref:Uncharacterized protein n=1 Tax=Lepraria finkii TaxID=1340010 RepID=A0ABR4AJE9_9LECA